MVILLLAFAAPFAPAQNDFVAEGDVLNVHDPVMIRQGGFYYVFHTSRRGGIDIKRSPDLLHWKVAGKVFEQLPAWMGKLVPGVRGLWAPDISFHNGKYYLYYAGSRFGANDSFIGLATNATLDPADPKYQWIDEGLVLRSQSGRDDFNAIDPNAVYDEQGGMWLVFGSFFSGIKLLRLDAKTGKPAENPPKITTLAWRPAAPHAIEAPFIVKKNDFHYLFVSFDFCARGEKSDYNIRVGRSKKLTGPYLDREGREMKAGGGTIVLQSEGNVRGPGHCGLLMNDRGTDWLVHHFYDARVEWRRGMKGLPTLQVRPIVWTKDGWPQAVAPYQGK